MFVKKRQIKCNAWLLLTFAFLFLLSIAGNVYQGYLLSRSSVAVVSCDACPCSEAAHNDGQGRNAAEKLVTPHPSPLESRALVEDKALASSSSSASSTSPSEWSAAPSASFRALSSAASASPAPSSEAPPEGSSPASSGASSDASASSAAHSGHHGNHPHDALIFFFNAVLIGTAVLHLSSIYPTLQLTVALFVIGVLISLVLEGLEVKESIGIFGESYAMWMNIDPHLLLFTMLPTLLAGDAMSIDTSVAKRVFFQCLYLAGPGVIASAMTVAGFLCLYLGWDFLLSLTVAAILCATDPVAVVALLKELAASPLLTTQIQGESLLNDGTAIVLYTVAYEMLCGKSYDVNDMAIFMVKTALMAVALGVFLGYVFFSWVRAAGNRFSHHSSVIQILLTLSAAYWSFIMAEGVFKMSGVLACVGSSIVLAHHMWPHIVHQHTVQHFWHTLEDLGNIIIFILGGALTGAAMVNIKAADYFHLLVIYMFLVLVRGTLIFASRPILRILNQDKLPVSYADASVMTWGGLRGAVGLALAIQVQRGRAPNSDGIPQIDAYTADRALFFVAGVAFLTTTVNATTTPHLVKWLGITAMPRAQEAVLKKFNDELVQLSLGQEHPAEVTDCLRRMVAHIEHHIHDSAATKTIIPGNLSGVPPTVFKRSDHIIDAYQGALLIYTTIPEKDKERLDKKATKGSGASFQQICEWLSKREAEEDLCKVVIKIFMHMVAHSYILQIEHGDIRPGSPESDVLFTSVRVCLSPVTTELLDFDFVLETVRMKEDFGEIEEHHKLPEHMKQQYKRIGKSRICQRNERIESTRMTQKLSIPVSVLVPEDMQRKLHDYLKSPQFHWTMVAMIVFNTIYVVVEEAARQPSNDNNYVWLIFECLFTCVFLVEAVMKILNKGVVYFQGSWNCFDFLLVVLGIFGIVMNIVSIQAAGAATQGSAESRVIRISRVLRTMRLMRVFRLFHMRLSADKFVSDELALCMHQMQTLMCFVQAHERAQADLVKYFSGSLPKQKTDVEAALARCVLQSQAAVYKAMICIVQVQRMMDAKLLDEFRVTKMRKNIVEELEEFVMKAEEVGAITTKEAEAILHPMHEEIALCLQVIAKRTDGVITKDAMGSQTFEELRPGYKGEKRTSEAFERTETGQFSLGGRRTSEDFERTETEQFSLGGGRKKSLDSPLRIVSNESVGSNVDSPSFSAKGVPESESPSPNKDAGPDDEDDPSKSLLRGVPKASFQPSEVVQPSSDRQVGAVPADDSPDVESPQNALAPSTPTASAPGDAEAGVREASKESPGDTQEASKESAGGNQEDEDTELTKSGGGKRVIKKKKKVRASSAGVVLAQEYGLPESKLESKVSSDQLDG